MSGIVVEERPRRSGPRGGFWGRRWKRGLELPEWFVLMGATWVALSCQYVFGDFEVDPALGSATNAACRSGDLRCNDEYLLSCQPSEDGWQLLQACSSANGCDSRGGHCLECTPGDIRCNGAVREGCAADGSGWQALETCADATLCNPSFCGPCPNLGEVRCAAAPDTGQSSLLQRCVANQGWQTLEDCRSATLCTLTVSLAVDSPDTWNNQCQPPGCPEAGALHCEGSTLYRCPQSLEGWMQLDVCDSAQLCEKTVSDNSNPRAGMLLESCESGCAPAGGYFCEGAELLRCRDDQTGYDTVETCGAGLSCNPTLGECSGPCRAGEYRCNAFRLERCDDAQSWELLQVCDTAALCTIARDPEQNLWSGSCLPPTCAVDEHRCDQETLLRCNDDRTAWVQDDVCASAALCEAENKRCRSPVCEAGARRCNPANPQQLEQCNESRTGRDSVTVCPDNQACNADPDLGPDCLESCPENPVRCVGATRETCSDETGRPVWSFDATCASEELCRCGLNESCALNESGKCGAAVCGGSLPSFRCTGSVLERCATGRHRWDTAADCGASELCDSGTSTSPGSCLACPLAGEVRCQGTGARRTCSSDRSQWTNEQACSYGCVDDGTSDRCAVCFASELRCDQNGDLDICTAKQDALVDLLDCEYGCLPDNAGSMDSCAACSASESRCVSGNQRHVCNSDRRGMTLAETCTFSCLDEGLEDRCGECAAGELQCQGDELRVCNDSVWEASETCDLVCITKSSGDDYCAEQCVPGDSDCLDATTRRDCDDTGSWDSGSETCNFACIDNGQRDFCAPACAPGTRRCTSTKTQYQQCDAQGSWPSQATTCLAPTPVCLGDGECVACDPNGYVATCQGNVLRTCTSQGALQETTCPQVCVQTGGIGACRDCTDGQVTCSETDGVGQLRVCAAGSWSNGDNCAPFACAADGKSCAQCAEGDTVCSSEDNPDGELSTCQGGMWGAKVPCAAATGCLDGERCSTVMGTGGASGSGGSGGSGTTAAGGSG